MNWRRPVASRNYPEEMLLKYTLLCALAFLAYAQPAPADGVITLQLETPGLQASAQKPEPEQSAPKVTTVTAQAVAQKTIGRVALVTADRASIYARQSSRSRVYAVCCKDTPLAVVASPGAWYGVLMIDASTGWIRSNKIKLLNYGVVASPRATGTYAYRGGWEERPAGNGIVQTALQYLGVPYRYGGSSASSGIDCSAFVKAVFARFGVNLPRVSRDQANVGTPVSWEDLQPGDRLYFACKNPYVDHCGIYMGSGYFIHASASRGGVAVENLSSKYYSQSLVAAMR